uniref:(California timema) hypothetical protein n=1 Tax=Timema californicum TaxID=61474 RepID=A0A7R9IWH7_TIMCA|nr:unnamed protein product [Timema californicum]
MQLSSEHQGSTACEVDYSEKAMVYTLNLYNSVSMMTEAKHRKLPSDSEDNSENEFCLDFYTIHRKNNEVSISLNDDSNDSLKDNYINEADLRDDPSVDISSDIRKSAKLTHASNSTRNLRTNSHQKQTQRPKNVDQTSKKASSCNDGVDTMDITSSVSLKNRLRSRKKKQIIIDTLDLTDEVSLPVKPSPVIIDNLYQPITSIFQHFAKAEGVSEDRICFEWEGKYPRITDTPDSLGIEYLAMFDGGTAAPTGANTRAASPARSKLDANTLELKVQRKGVKRPMMVRIKKTDQMIVLMVQCAEQLNLPLDKLKFSFDGEDVNKSDTPAYLELEGGECVDLFVSS